MTGFHADVGSGRAPPRTRTRLEDHPVYAVLPQKVQVGLTESARRLSLEAGEAPPSNALYFVLNGALGFFPSDQRICVGVVPPGSVLGWEGAIGVTIEAHNTRAILPTVGYIAPLNSVRTLLKSTWIHQFLAAYAASRARALGVEAACNARHTALQRLAKWIARLHAADGEERGISSPKASWRICSACSAPASTRRAATCRTGELSGFVGRGWSSLTRRSFRRRPAIATLHWRTALRNSASAIG
jgi:CRP-like cAMP-binding protein